MTLPNYPMEELYPLFQRLAEKYTGKQSTSVSYEKAEQLMEAVIYAINEYWNEQSIITAASESQFPVGNHAPAVSAKDAYEQGSRMVVQKVMRIKALYEKLLPTYHSYGNEACKEVFLKGIPAFLLRYDPIFCPQDHLLTLDYPLLQNWESCCGVDLIWNYLAALRLEQRFLSCFPEEYIYSVLRGFNSDYENLYFNLCEPVLKQVISCMLCKRPVQDSSMTELHHEQLQQVIVSHSRDAVTDQAVFLLKSLLLRFSHDDELLLEYLQFGLSDILAGFYARYCITS